MDYLFFTLILLAAFAGLVYAGVVQVNALVDAGAPTGDAVPLHVTIPDWGAVAPAGTAATVRIR